MTTSGLLNLKTGDALTTDLADWTDGSSTPTFSTVTANTVTVNTALVPDAVGGANIGSATAEWGDVYIADDKKIYFGNDQDNNIEFDADGVATLLIAGAVTFADGATDVDIASHDTSNGLKLGGTLVTATAAELNYLDIAALGTGVASKAVVLDGSGNYTWPSGKLTFETATSGLLFGSGASGANHSLGATADNAIEFYLDATHTTGDMRGEYLRLYFSGAGGSGEAARIFSTINNVSVATGGTVNGAHISIGTAGASAAVSGAANALRATFGIAALSTNIGGTCAVIQVDTDINTGVTVPSTFSFLRFTNTNTLKSDNLFNIPNVLAETDGLFCAHVTQTMTHSIKIISADGTKYYIMCTNANTNRTEA